MKNSLVPCCNLSSPTSLKSHSFSLFNFQTFKPSTTVGFSVDPFTAKGMSCPLILILKLIKSLSFSYSKLSLNFTTSFSFSGNGIV